MGRLRVLLVGTAFVLLGCSGDHVLGDYPQSTCDLAEPPAEVSDEPLTIATFWAADTREQEAFEELRRRIAANGYSVLIEQIQTRIEVQRRINESFESQKLPDVFQVNGGSDVLRWVQNRDAEGTDVCALDRLRDRYGWSDSYFPVALEPLSCHGNLYGLPVGIHHLNVLFYNRELFANLVRLARAKGLQLVEPGQMQSVDELLATLARVAELGATTPTGKPLQPLAIGTESEWPLTIVAFENVLLSLGHNAYQTLWMGGLETADTKRAAQLRGSLTEMLSVLRELRSYTDVSTRLSWQDALRQVGSGEALLTITGDWGYAQLDPEATAGVDTVTFPGTADKFVYTPDSFAVPRELKKNGFPARSFLDDVVANKAALIAFSNAKHSIPPRNDLSDDEVAALSSESLRSTYRQFTSCGSSDSDCELLLAVSGLAPPPGTDPCFDEMDGLLAYAVSGDAPADDGSGARQCRQELPTTSDEAEARLIELLLDVATRRFAATCR
jgi:ABC-type glycerol-3-phosphate transport system substrate-binding protein